MTNEGATSPRAADGDQGALNERLGEHLRKLRRQKGLSLLDVQELSQGEFKASVMGAYERGERAISALRLAALAAVYKLPLQAMLPADNFSDPAGNGLAIDVTRLDHVKGAEAKTVRGSSDDCRRSGRNGRAASSVSGPRTSSRSPALAIALRPS